MMEIRVLSEADLPELDRFLEEHSDSSMFLRSNLKKAGIVNRGLRFQGTYVAAFRNGHIIGAVAHYWQGNLLLQAPEAAGPLVRAATRASGGDLMGVIGPESQVQEARDALPLGGRRVQLDSSDGLYALELRELVRPRLLDEGSTSWERVGEQHREPLEDWFYAYHVELLGAPESPETRDEASRRLEVVCNEGVGYLLRRDGLPVSYSGFNAQLSDTVQIGGVYTPPHARSQGLARAAVAASLCDVQSRGATRAILFTGDGNYAAIAAYRALGFQRTGDFRLLLLA